MARAGGTHFSAGRGQSLSDAVIAERAFVCGIGFGIDEAASVRTGLHAVAATQAIIFVHQNDAVGTHKRRPHGTDLSAGRIGAVVAQFGDEEILAAGILIQWKTVFAAVGRLDARPLDGVIGDVVALNPGAVVALGDIVFLGAGANATAAADALGEVDEHSPPMV